MKKIFLSFIFITFLFVSSQAVALERICVAIHQDYENIKEPVFIENTKMIVDLFGCQEAIRLENKQNYTIHTFYGKDEIAKKIKNYQSLSLHQNWSLEKLENALGKTDYKYFNLNSDIETRKKEKQLKEKKLLAEKRKKQEEYARKVKLAKIEKDQSKKKREEALRAEYSSFCEPNYFGLIGHDKGTPEYEKCINEKIAEAKKAKLAKLEEEKLKKLAAKQEQEKLAKMSADDRRDYTCDKKFGFRKGSQQFNDCRFKLFTAEMELQKIQMQKELAEAKVEVAKARADAERARAEAASTSQARQEALLSAQTEAAKMQAAAAMAQAQASNMQSSLQMINQGLNMMSGPTTPSVNLRTTCSYTGRFLNCF